MVHKQGYKARRDESYGMSKGSAKSNNDMYMSKGLGSKVMGHDKAPKHIYVPEGQGFKEVKPYHQGYRGYPSQAFDYKY